MLTLILPEYYSLELTLLLQLIIMLKHLQIINNTNVTITVSRPTNEITTHSILIQIFSLPLVS